MKEYNIFLKQQPEGKVIIKMLTYYTTISVKSGLLINMSLFAKLLKRFPVSNPLILQPQISSINKRAFERIHSGITITALPNFLVQKYVEDIEHNVISIEVSDLNVVSTRTLNGVVDGIEILQSISEVKRSQDKFLGDLYIQGGISETAKTSFLQCNSGFEVALTIDDLLYRDDHLNGISTIGLEASVGIVSIRYRLLAELDPNSILGGAVPPSIDSIDIDNMTLGELDYIILED